MNLMWILICGIAAAIASFTVADRFVYSGYQKRAFEIRELAGKQASTVLTEKDFEILPEPVARYMRFSGMIGRSRISVVRLWHSGRFRPGAGRPFRPIKGEYSITTSKPSFCWYGKLTLFPGFTAVAIDQYFEGQGRMQVKVMSSIPVVDAHSPDLSLSAFGRCIAEMTMAPSFFLDPTRIRWINSDSSSAEFLIQDAGLQSRGWLFVRPDGALDKVVVERNYDRGKGLSTLERFTGKNAGMMEQDGMKIPKAFDGFWNLKEGDLHYVHFEVDRFEFV